MIDTLDDVVSRLDCLKSADMNGRVRSLANLKGFRSIFKRPFMNNVSEVLSLWQLRHRNTDITGVPIPGAPFLIQNLKQLPAETKVEQYGFTGKKRAGCIFFNHETGEFLGDTIVERRPKSQAMLDLEDHMIDPISLARARSGSSRKSA
jgi:hypothetical protein